MKNTLLYAITLAFLTTVMGLPAKNVNNLTVYVAPWGKDSNDGLGRGTPLATLSKATLVVSNTTGRTNMSRILLIDGTNFNELVSPRVISMPTNCALDREINSWIVLTNNPLLWNQNTKLNLGLIYISASSAGGALYPALYPGSGTLSNSSENVYITGEIESQAGGIRIEGQPSTPGSILIDGLRETCNRGCLYFAGASNVSVIIKDSLFIQTNWFANIEAGAKPHYVFYIDNTFAGTSCSLQCYDSTFLYSDANQTKPTVALYFPRPTTNMGTFSHCTFVNKGLTNASSYDVGTASGGNMNCVSFDLSTHKADGTAFVEGTTPGESLIKYLPTAAPYSTTSNPTNSFVSGTVYTNAAQRSLLIGWAEGTILHYTNSALAYQIPVTNNFNIPLSPYATFSFDGGVLTNVVNWGQ
jgi:hypothetical protein